MGTIGWGGSILRKTDTCDLVKLNETNMALIKYTNNDRTAYGY